MSKTVLITGASSGLGEEFAKIAAAEKYNLVLVARSEQKLNELAADLSTKYGVSSHVIAIDLSVVGAAQALFQQTEQAGIEVDVLVNNAGFGGYGKFHERDLVRDDAMIQLNIGALTDLTHLYVQGMVKRNKGKILNVGSTAGFLPGPFQVVYFATKAYVNSFSQALAEELSDTNITVTCLCPGPVATGFAEAGELNGSNAFKNAANATTVAELGWQGMNRGQLITYDQGSLKFVFDWVTPLLPRKLLLKLSRKGMEKSN